MLNLVAFVQTSSTLGLGITGYNELYAMRNKIQVLKFASAGLTLHTIKIPMEGIEVMLLCCAIF